jgi:hypothetical protein
MSRLRLLIVLLALLALALLGCQGETYLTGGDCLPSGDDDDSADVEEQHPEFDGSTLAVYSPLPAGIFYLENDMELDAEVLDADGEPLDFDDIIWETDLDDDPILEGKNGDVELDWGIHTLTVTADLPNGTRLQTVLGGIRVQGEHTGIYAGNFAMNIDIEYQGTPITASCLGGLDFVVEMDGETLIGDSGQCTINLVIMGEMDVSYSVDGEIDGGDVTGAIQLDLGFFDLPVSYDGSIDDGDIYAEYGGSVVLFEFNGNIDAHRVSPYVDM